MKQKLLYLAVLFGCTSAINAQTNVFPSDGNVGIGTTNPQAKLDVENNILLGLGSPAYGVRIKANFPSYSGGWSRGFFVVNQDNSTNYIGLGVLGSCSNGITTMDRAWIGPDYNNPYMNFLLNGNVGIGTTTPGSKLEIFNTAQTGHLLLSANDNFSADYTRIDIDFHVANTGHTIGRIASMYDDSSNGGSGGLRFYSRSCGSLIEKMRITASGNIGIGTTSPDQKLTVKGKIHAEEVIVDLNVPAADYVFAKDYSLMPLHKVEQYVKTNSHLPDVPSATEIKDKGLSMGEMQNKLLQKIEELTLYVIDLKKENEQINKRVKELETK
jgi:hypothetical protein